MKPTWHDFTKMADIDPLQSWRDGTRSSRDQLISDQAIKGMKSWMSAHPLIYSGIKMVSNDPVDLVQNPKSFGKLVKERLGEASKKGGEELLSAMSKDLSVGVWPFRTDLVKNHPQISPVTNAIYRVSEKLKPKGFDDFTDEDVGRMIYDKTWDIAAPVKTENKDNGIQIAKKGESIDIKRTNPTTEYASSYLHGLNPFGIVANVSGFIKALKDPPHENAGKNGGDNIMPSVGIYRTVSRLKSHAYRQDEKHHGKAKDNYLAELLGSFTSGATPTIAGAALGAYMTKDKLMDSGLQTKDRLMGMAKGVGAGLAVATGANLIALLASAITKRRTENEQVEHDKRWHWEDWLIPGTGMYNKGKRLGRSEGDYEEHPEGHANKLTGMDRDNDKLNPYLKALAIIAGLGMAGYGMYKLPSVVKARVNKIKDIANLNG